MVGVRAVVLMFALTALAGCANIGDEGVLSSDNKSVGNVKDSFGYSLSAANKTKNETYRWENGAMQAIVSYSGAVQEGTVTLTIQDAIGRVVYSGHYSGNDSHAIDTETGVAGTWTIEMAFEEYYGALSLGITAHYGAL